MSINELRFDLSIKGKNGIGFLLAGSIIWIVISIIFLLDLDIFTQNISLFFASGAMFPLALFFSKLIKADWKMDDNPLSTLGLILNLAQLIYFPLVFWAFVQEPTIMMMVYAAITGAHFYPYGWFYQATSYYIIAPILTVLVVVFQAIQFPLWSVSLLMVSGLLILSCFLYVDYKKKIKFYSNTRLFT